MDFGIVRNGNYHSWFEAAKTGNIETLKKWLSAKIWVNLPDDEGNSALFYAAQNNQRVVVEFLERNGAHLYKNEKGKTPLDFAVGEVRAYLKSKKHKISILKELIIEKAFELKEDHQKTVKFIFSLPEGNQKHLIEEYTLALTLMEPSKVLDFLYLIKNEETKEAMIKKAINFAQFSGDLESANSFIEALPKDNDFRMKAEYRKKVVEILFEMYEQPECRKILHEEASFSKLIRERLETTTLWFHGIEKENVEKIILGITACASFKGASKYINTLENKLERAFARSGLSSCGLESLTLFSEKIAEKIYEAKKWKVTTYLLENLEKAKETKDYKFLLRLYNSDSRL